MRACWSRECEDRPSFQTLSEELLNMQKEEQPYVNVDPSQAGFILPPTSGRGMYDTEATNRTTRPTIICIKCEMRFWRKIFQTPGDTCYIVLTNPFFVFFISDTLGNLIAFSDGTFSGETADHDEVEMEELPKRTVSIIFVVTAPEPPPPVPPPFPPR